MATYDSLAKALDLVAATSVRQVGGVFRLRIEQRSELFAGAASQLTGATADGFKPEATTRMQTELMHANECLLTLAAM